MFATYPLAVDAPCWRSVRAEKSEPGAAREARLKTMLDLLTDYHETTVEYEGPDGGELIRQTCLGWSMGGCDTVWADVLQRVLCRNGRRLVGGCTVLELGAGCGQLGLLAANWASRVDLTDGDEEEVTLIGVNIEQHSPAAGAELRAVHLDWSRPKEAEGWLLGRESYDVILASQVSYIPSAIPDLARTIRYYLAPGGTAYLYNDQVGGTPLGTARARSPRSTNFAPSRLLRGRWRCMGRRRPSAARCSSARCWRRGYTLRRSSRSRREARTVRAAGSTSRPRPRK